MGEEHYSPFANDDNDGSQEEDKNGKTSCTDAQDKPHLLRSLRHFKRSLALLASS